MTTPWEMSDAASDMAANEKTPLLAGETAPGDEEVEYEYEYDDEPEIGPEVIIATPGATDAPPMMIVTPNAATGPVKVRGLFRSARCSTFSCPISPLPLPLRPLLITITRLYVLPLPF